MSTRNEEGRGGDSGGGGGGRSCRSLSAQNFVIYFCRKLQSSNLKKTNFILCGLSGGQFSTVMTPHTILGGGSRFQRAQRLIQKSRQKILMKRFTRQPSNSQIISFRTQTSWSRPGERVDPIRRNLAALPSWRPQTPEAWSHADGTRIRTVMGLTIFRPDFRTSRSLKKPEMWLLSGQILTDGPNR